MRSRIMYVEDKSGGLASAGRIGRVQFSKSGATLYYAGRSFQSLKGGGCKANYFDIDSGASFWISGPRRDGADGLYGRITGPADVDPDVAEAYWRDIRRLAAPAGQTGAPTAIAADRRDLSDLPVSGFGRKQSRLAKVLQQRRTVSEAGKVSTD